MPSSDVFLLILLSFLICATVMKAEKVSKKVCRIDNGNELTKEVYGDYTCKVCYQYVQVYAPATTFTVRINVSFAERLEPEFWKNESHPYNTSFSDASQAQRQTWISCCDNAAKCCDEMLAQGEEDTDGCPQTWNYATGCWPKGDINRIKEIECPNHYPKYYAEERSPCRRYAKRRCLNNGTWGNITDFCGHMEFQRYKLDYDPKTSERKKGCQRTEREVELSYEAYLQDTCARCYNYMPRSTRYPDKILKYNPSGGYLYHPINTTEIFFADEAFTNQSGAVVDSFKKDMTLKWFECCKAAKDCWDVMEQQSKQGPKPDGYCPMTWDGWSCIKATAPKQTFSNLCPDHIFFTTNIDEQGCKYKFKKTCLWDGYWARRVDGPDTEYTDYGPCTGTTELQNILYFDISMLVVSMVAIIPALIIFNIYRSLRIPRIKMHVQLMLALLFYCLSAAIFKGTVLLPETKKVSFDNGPYCKIMVILYKYFRMSSYVWMFCEGFYLHRQIAAAFSEQRKFWYFYVLGWGFPLIMVSTYAIIRKVQSDEKCWVIPETIEYLIHVPIIIFLVMNLAFLCHIVYILVTKLRSVQSNEPGHYRKAVRATLVLIPLFGIHTFFVMYRPDDKNLSCVYKDVLKYFSSTVDGLQGFAVATIYCYLNNEVISLLKNDYHRYKAVRWIGQGQTQRPGRGGRWSVSTQVSAVHDHSTHNNQNGKASGVSHLDVPIRQPLHKTNGSVPVTEL